MCTTGGTRRQMKQLCVTYRWYTPPDKTFSYEPPVVQAFLSVFKQYEASVLYFIITDFL